MSPEDYLTGEETSRVKNDYVAGEVFAIPGAGEAHVTVAGNLFILLRNHVRGGPCRVYISDMKVRVEKADAYYSPDVFITCDPADGRENLFKCNPTLVVEVLSEFTAAFDQGAKFAHYRQLESLQEYVLIEPTGMSIAYFSVTRTAIGFCIPSLEVTSSSSHPSTSVARSKRCTRTWRSTTETQERSGYRLIIREVCSGPSVLDNGRRSTRLHS